MYLKAGTLIFLPHYIRHCCIALLTGEALWLTILYQYCGEEGSDCLLKGAIACSNPFNLDVASKTMASTFIGKEVYLRVMGSKFCNSWRAMYDARC
jgi:predicted alpha/beta-fold hydrolase